MIKTQDILDLGWVHVATASNGGSKHFQRGKELYIIENHADNFIYKKENDPKLCEIEIKELLRPEYKWNLLYKGIPNDVNELKILVEKYCI